MICAALFEIFLSLFAFTSGVKKMIAPITVIAFLPSIIFTPIGWHMIVVVIAILIAIRGLYVMRRTLFNGLKINIATIMRSGVAYVSFAIVLAVTSQYYFFIQQNTDVVFDPTHYMKISNLVIDHLLTTSNADDLSFSTMTVDDFLRFMADKVYASDEDQETQISDEGKGMIERWASEVGVDIEKVQEDAQEQAIAQMRANMSEMVGRDVSGTEPVTDVFSEMISTYINRTMMHNTFLRENKTTIFTLGFFLIIFSLASLVRLFATWGACLVFALLRESKIIRVAHTKRDAEVIVL